VASGIWKIILELSNYFKKNIEKFRPLVVALDIFEKYLDASGNFKTILNGLGCLQRLLNLFRSFSIVFRGFWHFQNHFRGL